MRAGGLKDFIAAEVSGEYFVGYLPPSPDAVTMIKLYGGVTDEELTQMRNPKFQILVRGPTYEDAESTIGSIFQALKDVNNVQISDRFVFTIRALQEPMYLGTDKQNRHEFSVNFQITSQE